MSVLIHLKNSYSFLNTTITGINLAFVISWKLSDGIKHAIKTKKNMSSIQINN